MQKILSNEIRIGNYVTIDNSENGRPNLKDKIFKIISISECESLEKGVWTHKVGLVSLNEKENTTLPLYSIFIDFIKPIILTDEIFKKLGGKINNENGVETYTIKGIGLMLKRNSCFFALNGIVRIKNVHHLQNIVYDISNEELWLN